MSSKNPIEKIWRKWQKQVREQEQGLFLNRNKKSKGTWAAYEYRYESILVRKYEVLKMKYPRPDMKIRQRILQRDGGICAICQNAKAESIHHIVPYMHCLIAGKGETVNDPYNLISLCQSCHDNIHVEVYLGPAIRYYVSSVFEGAPPLHNTKWDAELLEKARQREEEFLEYEASLQEV